MLGTRVATACRYVDPVLIDPRSNRPKTSLVGRCHRVCVRSAVRPVASNRLVIESRVNGNQHPICTADELHYVDVPNSDWKLALWRYLPSPMAPLRNHPLLLLSGVATNAIGYDLSPEFSFARHMSGQGFDTWILEVRGAGLSTLGMDLDKDMQHFNSLENRNDAVDEKTNNDSPERTWTSRTSDASKRGSSVSENNSEVTSEFDKWRLTTRLTRSFQRLSGRFSDLLQGGLLENSEIANQINQGLQSIIQEGQNLMPKQVLELEDRFVMTVEELQKQLQLILKCNWDFDHFLLEDLPAAMNYIKTECEPVDGKLLAIGHSMGGILLYAMLSRCCFCREDPCLAAVVTLGSSLDYTSSRSSLKLLLPLVDPAHALNITAIPVGTLLAAVHPLVYRPPYMLSWLSSQVSAQGMMEPKLLEKLVLKNFCTVPSNLLIQLATAFQKGGLRDRSGTVFYKDHLPKTNVPILALAGDQDLICSPEAVYETVKLIPENLVTFRVFGEPGGPHFAHYDIVGGRLAAEQLYPYIIEFLIQHDTA